VTHFLRPLAASLALLLAAAASGAAWAGECRPSDTGAEDMVRRMYESISQNNADDLAAALTPDFFIFADGKRHTGAVLIERMKAAGELLESAEVHGNGYGTPHAPVEKVLAEGRDMLFDIDWQGAKQVRERLGDDVVSIFVLPPSMRELRARLERRAEDTASSIQARFENAKREIERWRDYHYVVVNDDLNRAYGDIVTIVTAERLRSRRVEVGIENLVERLMAERALTK